MTGLSQRLMAGWVGAAIFILLLLLWSLPPDIPRGFLRERALDALLPLLPRPAGAKPEIVIVDIDRDTIAALGPWPWPRTRLARLVNAAAMARPTALGIDILIEGSDRFSAAALLDALSPEGRSADVAVLAAGQPDGDAALAAALAVAPAALGFGLDNSRVGPALPVTPILLGAPMESLARLSGLWQASGIAGPLPAVAAGAQGFGALVAAADVDGPIRRVPLLVLAGSALRPGLAMEVVRLAQEAGAFVIDGHFVLHAGAVAAPLGRDASLRLVQRPPAAWDARTVSALALLNDPATADRLAGQIVLIGSSAPELGGLRVTPVSPVTPSVQIQAEAVAALLRGMPPYRPAWLGAAEVVGAAVLGVLGLLLAAALRPLPATLLVLAACAAWAGSAVAAVPGLSLLVDPVGPALLALLGFAVAELERFVREEWRARLLRASFEQHLAPAVVQRIAADPTALRLQGELREITALFTDIEGFSSMTERADPADLVALLDQYFDAMTRIVTDFGGMVDKIAGDAVHAFFNAPFALPGHPERAVSCALALLAEAEAVRRSVLGRRLRLGRTRIGIETGSAIVGDVGGSRKLDYTAHGNAVNMAARLEGANKEFGTSICIGPGTADRVAPGLLRPVGTLTLRGYSRPIQVFTPAVLVESTPR
jgi:adenylate cyclase